MTAEPATPRPSDGHLGPVETAQRLAAAAGSGSLPDGSEDDREAITRLLGHPPRGPFEVVVRDRAGSPVVIQNAPLLGDGTPMPTRYWLVGASDRLAVDRLESTGGVSEAEASVDPAELAAAHARYATEREGAVPEGWPGPRPSGGVGGTRRGVKCLHAHYAWFLAGGDDPVGRWVKTRLDSMPGHQTPPAGRR